MFVHFGSEVIKHVEEPREGDVDVVRPLDGGRPVGDEARERERHDDPVVVVARHRRSPEVALAAVDRQHVRFLRDRGAKRLQLRRHRPHPVGLLVPDVFAVDDPRLPVRDGAEDRDGREEVGRVANVYLDARQVAPANRDLPGLAVPRDIGAHALQYVDDGAVALRARIRPLDHDAVVVAGHRARREQVRHRREVAGDRIRVVAAVPLSAGHPIARVRLRRLDAERVEHFERDVDVRRRLEFGLQVDVDSVLRHRPRHQQRRDVLRGHVAGNRHRAASHVPAHDQRCLTVAARALRPPVELADGVEQRPLWPRAERVVAGQHRQPVRERRTRRDDPGGRPAVRTVDHVVRDARPAGKAGHVEVAVGPFDPPAEGLDRPHRRPRVRAHERIGDDRAVAVARSEDCPVRVALRRRRARPPPDP